MLTDSGAPVRFCEHPPTIPVTFDDGANAHDLALRLNTLVSMRTSLASLHRDALSSRRNGEHVARQYTRQLQLASRLQRKFLPEQLPTIPGVTIDTAFCPAEYVSGDIYDVHRLDENHVGIALADATGHGMPAALLTVYVKRALRGKELRNDGYEILSPVDVLGRLNNEILDANLPDCPFLAAVYGVLNLRTRALTLARGGAPYPLLRRADGAIEVITSRGPVVGVVREAEFELTTVQLRPGDTLAFYSDGLESIVAPDELLPDSAGGCDDSGVAAAVLADEPGQQALHEFSPVSTGSLALADYGCDAQCQLTSRTGRCFCAQDRSAVAIESDMPAAAHELVTSSGWCATFSDSGPTIALEQARCRQRTLQRMGYPLDDLTILSIQLADSTA